MISQSNLKEALNILNQEWAYKCAKQNKDISFFKERWDWFIEKQEEVNYTGYCVLPWKSVENTISNKYQNLLIKHESIKINERTKDMIVMGRALITYLYHSMKRIKQDDLSQFLEKYDFK